MVRPVLDPDARTSFIHRMEETLYRKTRLRLYAELMIIIQENSALQQNRQRVMHYQGQVFSYGPTEELPKPINPVHRDVRDRLKQYIADKEAMDWEKDVTLGYLSLILLKTSNLNDLKALLPHALHQSLRSISQYFIQGPGTLRPEEIQIFQENNQQYFKLLKARLAYNLLDVAKV